MLQRFTEEAQRVVVSAQQEARILKHNYVGTEHILLGLLREDEGLGAQMLESFEVSLERVRAQVLQAARSGDEGSSGQLPFRPEAKKALELSLRESLALGHDHIGSGHILLGLLSANEGLSAEILVDFEVDSERLRSEVIRVLPAGAGDVRGDCTGG